MPRNDEHPKRTSNRGFASMDREKQRAIASKGGQSVPPEKRSFSQDPNLAAQAGRKGGESVPPEGRSFSQNRALAAEAGRKGGQARGASNQRARGAGGNEGSTEENGNTEAKAQGKGFKETRETATEGARKASLPQDHLDTERRDDDRPTDLRSGGEDVEQVIGPGVSRTGSAGGKQYKHPR